MSADAAYPRLSGAYPGALIRNYLAPLIRFRISAENLGFCLSGELIRNCFGKIARISAENLLIRLSPYGRDRFSDKRPSLGDWAALGGLAA